MTQLHFAKPPGYTGGAFATIATYREEKTFGKNVG
jgi:hypothetical protein